jgi:hypothetical protein
LDIYIAGEDGAVEGIQCTVPGAGSGGEAGRLDIDCSSVAVDESHPNYPPESVISSIRIVECPEFAMTLVVAIDGTSLTIGDSGTYGGEFCYDLSANAAGTFAVDFSPENVPPGYGTVVLDSEGFPITQFITIDGADITALPAPACCLPDGACEQLDLPECVAAGGYQPGPLNCADVSCLGGCCVDNVCSDVSRAQCDAAGGIFYGEGIVCAEIDCGCFEDAHCDDGDECTIDRCVDNECINCQRHAADVNQDCAVNLFDAFCVLNAMNGDFGCDQPCP